MVVLMMMLMMMVMVMLMMMMMMRGDDNVDIEEEEEDAVEEDDVEEEDRSQDREAHFVRTCAVEMQMDITRGMLRGNLFGHCWSLLMPPRLNTGP